jgi:glycosyltransferase involved in cell wall biosynthesis
MLSVSIVTTSFNQARFLERAILSVLAQNYPSLEYIVLDPGSTDGSRAIIERYRDRITKVIFDPDRGPADGLNRGLARATGDICAYINSDDALLPGAISKAVKAFEDHPEADVIYAHGFMVDEDDRILRRVRSTRFDLRRYLYGGVSVFQQSTFFKRSAFVEVDGFNPETRVGWDGELLVRFARAERKFHLVNDTWAVFRIHPRSMTGSRSRDGEYYKLHRRLFREVIGREPRRRDYVLQTAIRLEKWLRDPLSLPQSLRGRLLRSSHRSLRGSPLGTRRNSGSF